MKKRDIVNYFGRKAEVIDFNLTHVLIKLESGSKLCTLISTFNKDYK